MSDSLGAYPWNTEHLFTRLLSSHSCYGFITGGAGRVHHLIGFAEAACLNPVSKAGHCTGSGLSFLKFRTLDAGNGASEDSSIILVSDSAHVNSQCQLRAGCPATQLLDRGRDASQ